jgi:aminopeptidase N
VAFRHKIIDTETVVAFFNKESGIDFTPVFKQYLRTKNIPVLELRENNNKPEYRWKTDVDNFKMPVDIRYHGKEMRLKPANEWKKSNFKINEIKDIEVLTKKFLVDVIYH